METGITQHSLRRQNLRIFARIYYLGHSSAGSLDKQIGTQLPLQSYRGARDSRISLYQ
jgi:hypothetical protein